MYEVHGLNRKTRKFELVATGLSKQELTLVLKEEEPNYYNLNTRRIR